MLITHTRHGLPLIALLLLTSTADAQSVSPLAPIAGSEAPARESNIYDFRDHQPTANEESAAGIPAPSAAAKRQVEREVQQLLAQVDRLDKQSNQELDGASTTLPPRSGGW